MRNGTRVLLALGLVLAARPVTAQVTIWVPTQQPTIQGAITAANNGDTVMVLEGTYIEHDLDFLGKAVRVRSFGGAADTKINALMQGRGVLFQTGEGPDSILEGFTIVNGRAPDGAPGLPGIPGGQLPTPGGAGGSGGGILIVNSSPTIRDCVIWLCAAGDGGNGGTAPTDSIGAGQDGGDGGHGGGVHVAGVASPRIENCWFVGNQAGQGGDGGDGASAEFSGLPGGSAGAGGRGGSGGGLSIVPPTLSSVESFIVGCKFTSNYAGYGGSGGRGGDAAALELAGDGAAGGPGGEGGAAFVTYGKARFVGCRMFENFGGGGGHGGAGGVGGWAFFGSPVIPGGSGGAGGTGGTGGVRYGATNVQVHEAFSSTIIAQNDGGNGGNGGVGGQGGFGGYEGAVGGPGGVGGAGGDGGAGGLHSVSRLDVGSSNIHVNVAAFGGTGGAGGPGGQGLGGSGPDGSPGAAGSRLAGGIHDGGTILQGTNVEVFNSIVRANSPDEHQGSVLYEYSNIKGGAPGTGNIDAGVQFVSWQTFDYRLDFDSPCIDAGNKVLRAADAADVDRDGDVAEKLPLDVDLEVRSADDLDVIDTGPSAGSNIDMGAHERSAWDNLENGMSGVSGQPLFLGVGTLAGGDAFVLRCSNTVPSSLAFMVFSLVRIDAPAKGGVMVPSPSPPALIIAFPSDTSGSVEIAGTWPALFPPGTNLYMQFWIADADGPVGYAASNGVEGTTF